MIGKKGESRGFTVVELIVAMSISAVTLLSAYESFQALRAAGDDQSEDLAVTAGIVRGLDRIREDLLHALPRPGSLEPIFVGSNPVPENETESTPLLRFYSLGAAYGDGRLCEVPQTYQVGYELVKTTDSVRLYRSAAAVLGAGTMSGDEGRELILDHVERINIAFHNGRTSAPAFSSNEKLPTGVELVVTTCGQAWPLAVRLPCGNSEGQP